MTKITSYLRTKELVQAKLYINGRFKDSTTNNTFPVVNPATGEKIADQPSISRDEALEAVAFTEAALPTWKMLTAKERGSYLRRWFDLIITHQEDLATIMTLEQGKPLEEARSEILYAASFVEWFAEEAKRAYGDLIPAPKPNQELLVFLEPIGPVAAITPWNFPAAMLTRKLAPALAAGCTVIAKPSSETPLSALALAKLAHDAGIPPGVLNIITGEASMVGEVLATHPSIRKLSFTGSTAVGKKLLTLSSSNLKKLSLELGGNAPFIIFEDANLEQALQGLMASKFRNSGQTCVCANRVYIHRSLKEQFLPMLQHATSALILGEGVKPDVDQGPLINECAVRKVQTLLDDALQKGATIITGGSPKGKTFFEPTIIENITPAMAITNEEIFGPVVAITWFDSEEEVIRLANDTIYGLAAYFYSTNVDRIFRVAHALEYGMIGVNEGIISNEVAPFGGIKQSGHGREGSYLGLHEYMERKYVCLNRGLLHYN